MRDEIRDAAVVEVVSRVLAACLRQAESAGGMPIDVLINDTLYHEKKRLELHTHAARRSADIQFWDGIKRRLARAGELELAELLERVIGRFVNEVVGHFSPAVYRLSTKVLPRTLPVLLNAMSPRKMFDHGVPDLAATVRFQGRIDGLRRCQEQGTVILTPTHVSNLDSMICGWGIYAMGLAPVTYGAGLNLFSNPVLSFFMRNLGAYRVDRMKTAALYKDVLKEYATVTMEMGQSQLFFPGGTRSRGGRVEQHLKLGLLSCGLRAYINNLAHHKERPRIFIVPCSLNYHLVLEAETLIEDHLQLVGKSRYIITDDASSRPGKVLRFARDMMRFDSRIFMTIGDPLDVFGNRVDEEGVSRDAHGRRIDITRYVMDAQGRPAHVPQRDRVYTTEAGRAVAEAFRVTNVALSTNIVAFAFFEFLRARHPRMDLYRLLRTAAGGSGVEMGVLADQVRLVVAQVKALADAGGIRVAEEVAAGDPASIIGTALRYFGTDRHHPAIARRGDRVFAEEVKLLYYYRNRLAGYGFERGLAEARAGQEAV